MFKKISTASIALIASAQTALANDPSACADPLFYQANKAFCDSVAVPELSPMAGVAAVAAVLALVAFVWERRRAA